MTHTPTRDWPSDHPDLPGDADLVELEALAVDLAVRAGTYVRDERPDTVRVSATKSTALDVVTAMDTGSEQLIRGVLAQRRPDDGILGEEEGLTEGASGLTWVIDPIDGTVNYLYDQPAYAVSVAVVVGDPRVPGAWLPVAGAVSNPRVDEVFRARHGGGARVQPMADGRPGSRGPVTLRASGEEDLSRALVGTGFAYDRAQRQAQGELAQRVLMEVRDLRRMGAAALDLCAVAAGRLDAYYERGLFPWDLAAGALLVRESGGTVTGLSGPPGRDMVVAAGPHLHGPLRDLISRP